MGLNCKIAFVILFLVFSDGIGAQETWSEKIHKARSSSPETYEQIELLKDLELELKNTEHQDTLGILYYSIAFRYRREEDLLNTKEFSKKAEEAFLLSDFNGYQFANVLSFVGEAEEQIGNTFNAIAYFKKLAFLESNSVPRVMKVQCYAFERLIALYNKLSDHQTAINMAELALKTFDSEYYKWTIPIHLETSMANLRLYAKNGSKQAESHLNSAKYLFEKYNHPYRFKHLDLLANEAWINLSRENFSKANQLYKNVFDEYLKEIESPLGILRAARNAHNISEVYREQNLLDKSLEYAKYAEIYAFQSPNNEIGIETRLFALQSLCEVYLELKNFQLVIENAERALTLIDSIGKTSNYILFKMAFLYLKSHSYVAQSTKDHYSLVISSIKTIDTLLDIHIYQQLSDISVQNLKEIGSKYYQLGIKASCASYDLPSFHYFSEKAKALKLLEAHRLKSIQDESLRSIQEKLNELKYQIVQLELVEKESPSDSISALLTRLRVNQLDLVDDLKIASPANTPIVALDDFHTDGKTFIQYKFGTDSLYAMILSKERKELFNLGESDTLVSQIITYNGLLSDPNSDYVILTERGNELYNSLIAPLSITSEEIVIVPEEELFLFSFDALVADDNNYLGQVKNVSYTPSLSFFHETQKVKGKNREKYILLPEYESGSTLSPLQFSQQETQNIKDIIKGDIIKTKENDKSEIVSTFGSANVLHFAGHAVLDEEDNFLALSSGSELEDRIYQKEIYTQPTDANLVTLSACNTGKGQILKGEGIASLARAFLFSGSRSVVSTLWSVDDLSTSSILTNFYQHLDEGISQSNALHLAKRDYLRSAETYAKHPYYWAGVTLMGGSEYHCESISPLIIWLTRGFILLILIYLAFRIRRKPSF